MVVHYLRVNITFVNLLRFGFPVVVLLLVLLMSILSISCGKDDLKPPVKGEITWTVNGTTYTADFVTDAERGGMALSGADVSVRGISYAKSSLLIMLTPANGPGNFVTSDTSLNFHSVQVSVNNINYWAHRQVDTAVATVTVTELTADRIKGSFNGTLVEDRENSSEVISVNGAFDVPFSK